MTRRETVTRLACLAGLVVLGLLTAHVSYLYGGF
jgi:hypothetical protein